MTSRWYDAPTTAKLSNPCAQVLFPYGQNSYVFGNTPAVELTEHFGTCRKSGDTLNILLLGAGDIRNLLFTVSELSQRSEDAVPERVCFHVNDCDLSVLARGVIILEIVCSVDPYCVHDVDFLWNVWYNLALTKIDSARLQKTIRGLVSQEHLKSKVQFGSKTLFEECQEIWKDWLQLELNIDEVSIQRQKVMLNGLNLPSPGDDHNEVQEQNIFTAAVSSLTINIIKQLFTSTDERKLDLRLQKSGSCYQEIYSYFQSGCTSRIHSDSEVNPTLIRPFERKWRVHHGSCPFTGYIPIDGNRFEKFKSVARSCKETLKTWISHYQRYSPKIKVVFWDGDALELCRKGLPEDLQFDVVDTSNLSDHLGLLNTLVCCVRKLKQPGQSQLITSSMLWQSAGLTGLEEYLQLNLGIKQSSYPTILGLRLAEDLDLGKSDILAINASGRTEDKLIWVKTEPERSPINLARSPDILDGLKSMASRCFKLPCSNSRSLQLCGATFSSPLTFFLAFLQIAESFQESAEQVLSYVEEAMPTVRLFQKRSRFNICGLSWNVLKRLAGISRGAVLKVQAHVTFPTLPRITPVLQAVLFEDPSDARFLASWPIFQMKQRTFHRPVHLFYNNIQYDPVKEIVSFLILESDWEALHLDTSLLLISSSVNCTSTAVQLKSGRSKNTRCAKNGEAMERENTLANLSIPRSKRRKSSGLGRNISCISSLSCMSNLRSRGLQKYESCYQLDILPTQVLNTFGSGNEHSSTDCLLSTDNNVERFFQTGIDSPCFQLDADLSLGRADAAGVRKDNTTIKHEGDAETAVITEKVDDIMQSFGLLDMTLVTLRSSKTDHLELLAMEEHALCYNADILILRPFQAKACPAVKYHPKDLATTVEISLDTNRAPLKLSFSCPVAENSSKVQVLDDRNHLRCHFRKSELGFCGRACIKRPPILDFSSLPAWSSKKDLRQLIPNTSDEGEDVSDEEKAFKELQKTLHCIIASFVKNPQKNTCFTIADSFETGEAAPNLTVVIHEVYCRKQAPLAKVLFCDHSVAAILSTGEGNLMMAVKYKEVLIQRMENKRNMIHMTKQGQGLLKRLLYLNAKRVTQPESLKPVWLQSFLQLRF
ncbi:uncharacterized protein [Montipora capricornis]|uniref:uncharacterized protein isoform X1 n=1 Tax=Montipora capricornis TaxID=246305 RepID=UPI0035F112BA